MHSHHTATIQRVRRLHWVSTIGLHCAAVLQGKNIHPAPSHAAVYRVKMPTQVLGMQMQL